MTSRAHKGGFAALLLVVSLASCGSPDGDGHQRYHVLDYDGDEDRYELVESTIDTLQDARAVDGEIVELRGGGKIVIATGEPETPSEFEASLTIDGASTPRVSYELSDGLVTAWDYDSLLMLTLYHHFERAAFYFEEIGVDHSLVGKLPVYYAPRLEFLIPFNLLTDNAAYAFTLDAFLLPRQFFLTGLPFAANRGIIVHEYSHAVFNRLVHGDARAPAYLLEPWPDPAINRMRALDEGVADIFGALAVGDPNFISPSIAEEEFDIDRDLSVERHYTAELRDKVEQEAFAQFNPYELGTVIASTVWSLRAHVDDHPLGEAVIASLTALGEEQAPFSLTDFFDGLHDGLPEDVRPQACSLFRERLIALSEPLQCAP